MILPHDKKYLLECLQRAMDIIESLPDKKQCINCEHHSHGKCKINDYKEIPPHIKPNGCNVWEWDGVPF